ncbi:hypothetical protein [Streptomyces sp. NPDC051211]|uniref:hypothetical protein n=1 Tax=Streptomyces sp. NPDC051211 TaxID=3154643 RepID=UPI00344BFD78
MPRGRHRNPEPLHRLLTPSAVAGVSLTAAAVAWLPAEPLVLRLLVAVTAAVGITGAVFMRSWDRAAGRRVAELARERVKDEWRTEERIAELESDLEESRVLRTKLDAKLRAKRVELAGLRGEHAALLRRYATAETERASALEGRRLLAIEASGAAASAPKELPPVSAERTAAGAPTPVGYARAHAALVALARRAEAGADAPAKTPADGPAAAAGEAADGSDASDASDGRAEGQVSHGRPGPAAAVPARRLAATVAPYTAPLRSASRVEGGFDFFGTKAGESQARAAIEAVQNEDLADVVGEEALAVHKAESAAGRPAQPALPAAPASGQVIDLTAHDETEPIDVARLRTAIS